MTSAPTVREVDGQLVIDWPFLKPSSFEITPEPFEWLIGEINRLRTELAATDKETT